MILLNLVTSRYSECIYMLEAGKPDWNGDIIARELYDHGKDPWETRNLADNPNYANVVQKLALKLRQG